MENLKIIIHNVLRGLSQIMLQENAATGLLFVLGIAIHSFRLACASIVGAAIGTLWATLCKYPSASISAGLYGFNSALVAIAVSYFYSSTTLLLGLLLCGSIFATVIMHLMQIYQLKPYTFPFVFTLWLIFTVIPQQVIDLPSVSLDASHVDGVLQGFGQVMFQANSWTGLIFIAAILINNTKHAIWAVFAAILGILLAFLCHWSKAEIIGGMYSYNAVLAAIAALLITQQKRLVFFAILLSILFTKCMFLLSLPALTFPFILAMWCVVWGIEFSQRLRKSTHQKE